jgi:hypothetical protein
VTVPGDVSTYQVHRLRSALLRELARGRTRDRAARILDELRATIERTVGKAADPWTLIRNAFWFNLGHGPTSGRLPMSDQDLALAARTIVARARCADDRTFAKLLLRSLVKPAAGGIPGLPPRSPIGPAAASLSARSAYSGGA